MWQEPTQTLTCLEVTDNNVGNYENGYVVWKYTAINDECSEDILGIRADGSTVTIPVTVVPIACSSTCSYGMKRVNAAVCDCADVTTLPAAANLYLVSDPMSSSN